MRRGDLSIGLCPASAIELRLSKENIDVSYNEKTTPDSRSRVATGRLRPHGGGVFPGEPGHARALYYCFRDRLFLGDPTSTL